MSFDNNLYYHPEKFNLETVGQVEWSEPDYSFDFSIVWRHKETGEYFTAADSGCSCPSPFEDFNSLDELDGPFTALELVAHLRDIHEDLYGGDSYRSANEAQQANWEIAVIHERLFTKAA